MSVSFTGSCKTLEPQLHIRKRKGIRSSTEGPVVRWRRPCMEASGGACTVLRSRGGAQGHRFT